MPEFDRWVQRYVRRINVGEFLRDAAEWLAGFCFVFGVAVLAVKLRWPNLWPHVLWLIAASVPVTRRRVDLGAATPRRYHDVRAARSCARSHVLAGRPPA